MLLSMTLFTAGIEGWSGGLSPLEIITTIATPAGVIVAVIGMYINGRAANKTLNQSIHAARASQFQAACGLISAPGGASKTGGLYMMAGLAAEAPEDYLLPVTRTFDAVMIDADPEFKKICGYFRHPLETCDLALPTSDPISAELLQALSHIQENIEDFPAVAKKELAPKGDDLRYVAINMLYLKGFSLEELTLTHIILNKLVLGRCILSTSNLRHATLSGVVCGLAEFVDCDLRDLVIDLVGPSLEPILPSDGLLGLRNCQTDGLTINGLAYADWLKLEPRAAERQLEPA